MSSRGDEKLYRVRCDACGLIGESASRDTATGLGLAHVGSVHADANAAHMLGQHIHIEDSGAGAPTSS